jgi:uncharacterized protein YdaU (DUF1376 family)
MSNNIKLTKEWLEKLIIEELDTVREINAHHAADGTWAKKGKGKIYSLTANAEDDVGEDSDLQVPARGKSTASGKISSKFGMNTGSPDKQCGKTNINGSPKKKTRSCKHYPKNYWDKVDEILNHIELNEQQITKDVCDKCIQAFLARVSRANAAIKQAQDPKQPKNEAEQLVDETDKPEKKSHYQGSEIKNDKERKTDKRKQAERTKKIRRRVGAYVKPFSDEELSLTRPNNLWEWATKQ